MLRFKLFLLAAATTLYTSTATAIPGNTTANLTYNEAVRTVMQAETYSQALTAYEGFGPAIALLLIVPLFWNLLYAGLIGEWRCDDYWYVFLSTAALAAIMLFAFPVLIVVL